MTLPPHCTAERSGGTCGVLLDPGRGCCWPAVQRRTRLRARERDAVPSPPISIPLPQCALWFKRVLARCATGSRFCKGSISESSSFIIPLFLCPLPHLTWERRLAVGVGSSLLSKLVLLSKSIFEKCSFAKTLCFMKVVQIQESTPFSHFRKRKCNVS